MLMHKRSYDPGVGWSYAKDPGGTGGKMLDFDPGTGI